MRGKARSLSQRSGASKNGVVDMGERPRSYSAKRNVKIKRWWRKGEEDSDRNGWEIAGAGKN